MTEAYDFSNRSHYRERKAAELRKMWAEYDKCDWCAALPGMPCRDKSNPGRTLVMNRPHVSRTKKTS